MSLSIIHLAASALESRLLTSPHTDKFPKFYLSSELQNLLKPVYHRSACQHRDRTHPQRLSSFQTKAK